MTCSVQFSLWGFWYDEGLDEQVFQFLPLFPVLLSSHVRYIYIYITTIHMNFNPDSYFIWLKKSLLGLLCDKFESSK